MGDSLARLPPNSEIVDLLDRLAPGDAEELADDVLRKSGLRLEAGELCGDEEFGSGTKLDGVPEALAAYTLKAMQRLIDEAKLQIGKMRQELKRASQLRLLAQIATLIGGSTTVGTLFASENDWSKIAAIFTLLAALANLVVEKWESLVAGNETRKIEAYEFLASSLFKAEQLRDEVTVYLEYGDHGKLEKTVAKANQLCADMNRWLAKI